MHESDSLMKVEELRYRLLHLIKAIEGMNEAEPELAVQSS
jgi:hypothetical protein